MQHRLRFLCGVATLLALSASLYAQPSRRTSANSYLERGNQWLKKGDVERAIEDFSLALAPDLTTVSHSITVVILEPR